MTTKTTAQKNSETIQTIEGVLSRIRIWWIILGIPSITAVVGWVGSMAYTAFAEGPVEQTVRHHIETRVVPVLDTLRQANEDLRQVQEAQAKINQRILDFLEVMATPEQKKR